VYNYINEGPLGSILILVFIRVYLDCIDGAHARKCNRSSKLGAVLDIVGDTIYAVSIAVAVIYRYRAMTNATNISTIIMLIVVAWALTTLTYSYKEVTSKDKRSSSDNFFSNKMDEIIHDNSIPLSLLMIYLIKTHI
jgi:phosphatidylglycerophosphate synthase